MQVGLVVGTATSTVKHPTMKGQKLLVVQPLLADGKSADGDPQIAVDAVGAGRGERVLISSDGRYMREILKADATPVRWSVIGIAD
jgi:ethanolamine utilization protein EutN